MCPGKLTSWGLGFKLPINYGNLFFSCCSLLLLVPSHTSVKTMCLQTKWKWKLGPRLKHPLPACPLHNTGLSVAFFHVSFRSEPHLFIVSYMSLYSSATHEWPLVVWPRQPSCFALQQGGPSTLHALQPTHWANKRAESPLSLKTAVKLTETGMCGPPVGQTDRLVALFLCHM